MKHFHCVQGDRDWNRLRMGKPTASAFDKLITAKKWEPTKGETRRAYAIYLLTELILDEPLSGVSTASMQYGHSTEGTARAAYEMLAGAEVQTVGFCTNDEMTYGASPDAFVGVEGSLEIKSPFKPEIHVEYLMKPESLVEEYFVQVQGQLFVTGRQWTDLISYHPAFKMVKVRCLPHPEFQSKLAVAVHSFCAEFADLVTRAVDLKHLDDVPPVTEWIAAGVANGNVDMVRKDRQEGKKQEGDFDITDEEISRIWASRAPGEANA